MKYYQLFNEYGDFIPLMFKYKVSALLYKLIRKDLKLHIETWYCEIGIPDYKDKELIKELWRRIK